MVLIDGKRIVKPPSVEEMGGSGAPRGDGSQMAPSGCGGTSMVPMMPMQGMNVMGGIAGMGPMGGMGCVGGLGCMGGMGGFGMGMPMGGGGNFDFFAHMAAAARMQAAMFRQMRGGEGDEDEKVPAKRSKVDDDAPAFDADALHRLANDASKPSSRVAKKPAKKATKSGTRNRKLAEAKQNVDVVVASEGIVSNVVAPPTIQEGTIVDTQAAHRETALQNVAEAQAPSVKLAKADDVATPLEPPLEKPMEPLVKRKDATSVASLLQQVQSNVTRGRAAANQRDAKDVQQAFGVPVTSAAGGPGSLLEALVRRVEDGDISGETRRAIQREVLEMLPVLEPVRATDLIVRVCSADIVRTADFLEAIVQLLLPTVTKFNSPQLTRILTTISSWVAASSCTDSDDIKFSNLSDRCRDFFTGAAGELTLRLMDVLPRDLAAIATALSAVGYSDARLYSSLARAAAARSDRFLPQELVALGVAFDRASYIHMFLLEQLAKALRHSLREVTFRELVQGLTALARAGIRDEELGNSIGTTLLASSSEEQEHRSPEDLCELAWAFCALGMYHDAMFRMVFHTVDEAAALSSNALCLLYEIHLVLRCFRADLYHSFELAPETVRRLREHYRKQKRGGRFRESRAAQRSSSERLHRDLGTTLEGLVDGGSAKLQYQTPSGLKADVLLSGGRRVIQTLCLIELDGPHTLLQLLDPQGLGQVVAPQQALPSRVRGDVLLKRRILQHGGFRVAVLGEDLWRSLDEGRERRDFLVELLRNCGLGDCIA